MPSLLSQLALMVNMRPGSEESMLLSSCGNDAVSGSGEGGGIGAVTMTVSMGAGLERTRRELTCCPEVPPCECQTLRTLLPRPLPLSNLRRWRLDW